MPTVKTIVFDFGKVIGFFDHQRAIQQLLPYTPLPGEALERVLYGSELEFAYERGELSTKDYVSSALHECQLNCSPERFVTAFVDIFWRNEEICTVIPELKPHFRLLLASNTNAAHFGKFREQFADVLDLFDALCPSHFAGHRKPTKAYYQYCQRSADCDPNECLFVDDIPENIAGAMEFGWQGLVYSPGRGIARQLQGLSDRSRLSE